MKPRNAKKIWHTIYMAILPQTLSITLVHIKVMLNRGIGPYDSFFSFRIKEYSLLNLDGMCRPESFVQFYDDDIAAWHFLFRAQTHSCVWRHRMSPER